MGLPPKGCCRPSFPSKKGQFAAKNHSQHCYWVFVGTPPHCDVTHTEHTQVPYSPKCLHSHLRHHQVLYPPLLASPHTGLWWWASCPAFVSYPKSAKHQAQKRHWHPPHVRASSEAISMGSPGSLYINKLPDKQHPFTPNCCATRCAPLLTHPPGSLPG